MKVRLPFLALFGPHAMSDLSPECAPKRTSTDRSEFMGSRQSKAASVGGRRASRVLKETTPALDRAEAVLRECLGVDGTGG